MRIYTINTKSSIRITMEELYNSYLGGGSMNCHQKFYSHNNGSLSRHFKDVTV